MARWEPDARGRLEKAAMELFQERGYVQHDGRGDRRARRPHGANVLPLLRRQARGAVLRVEGAREEHRRQHRKRLPRRRVRSRPSPLPSRRRAPSSKTAVTSTSCVRDTRSSPSTPRSKSASSSSSPPSPRPSRRRSMRAVFPSLPQASLPRLVSPSSRSASSGGSTRGSRKTLQHTSARRWTRSRRSLPKGRHRPSAQRRSQYAARSGLAPDTHREPGRRDCLSASR